MLEVDRPYTENEDGSEDKGSEPGEWKLGFEIRNVGGIMRWSGRIGCEQWQLELWS